MASRGKVLILVENLPVPFDRRVWCEATAWRDAGYPVSVIGPKGDTDDREADVRLDEMNLDRFSLTSTSIVTKSHSAALLHHE